MGVIPCFGSLRSSSACSRRTFAISSVMRCPTALLKEAFRYAHRLDDVGRLESGACLAPYQVERVCNALADDGEPPGGEP